MGQKVNPISLRLGIIRSWDSVWYANRNYAHDLHEDLKIRKFIMSELPTAGIGRIKIERFAKKIRILLSVARSGVVLGKRGEDVQKIQKFVEKLTSTEVSLNIIELKKIDTNSILVANSIARQIEKRVSYKKAMKRAMQSAMKVGALGVRISVAGRLGGAEIARSEWYKEGRIPLHTLRADISFGQSTANTTFGAIGIKVWIYNGDKNGIEC